MHEHRAIGFHHQQALGAAQADKSRAFTGAGISAGLGQQAQGGRVDICGRTLVNDGRMLPDADLNALRETPARSTENWGSPPTLSNGYTDISIDDSWNTEGQVYILATDPTPLTLASFIKEVEFGG